jgi:CubicO group peptidase (beta-lactamase class C family)
MTADVANEDWFGSGGEAIVAAAMEAGGIEGLTLAIDRHGEQVVRGFGFADSENRVPAGARTVYRIGSLTKQFTAAAIMLLSERGAIRLDDTIDRPIPETPPGGRTITIETC